MAQVPEESRWRLILAQFACRRRSRSQWKAGEGQRQAEALLSASKFGTNLAPNPEVQGASIREPRVRDGGLAPLTELDVMRGMEGAAYGYPQRR